MPSPNRTAVTFGRIFLRTLLVMLGVSLAYSFYRLLGDGEIFAWSLASVYAPLGAALIGGGSAVLVGLWVVNSWGKFRLRHSRALLVSVSLIWMGFGAGLLGPAVLGQRAAWEISGSVLYSLELDKIKLPAELERSWSGTKPGAYIAAGGPDQLWIALNSSPPAVLQPGEPSTAGEVSISSFRSDPEWVFGKFTNLTKIDARVQQVRDIEPDGSRLVFSNIELKIDCMVLQVWSANLARTGHEIDSVELIWESSPCLEPSMSPEETINSEQSGGRLAIEQDGSVLVTVGDFRMGLSVHDEYEGRPIPLQSTGAYGKILRIKPDGTTELVSSGHRNPQGIFFDSETNRLWSSEHGPNAGGELNLIVEGSDYGWPDTTYGVPYGPNLPESELDMGRWGSDHEGFEKPILAWMPSIAPSQLIVYAGTHFSAWKGDILVATLKDKSLRRIRLDGDRVVFDERIFIGERVRDLVELHDGRLLLSFDSGGLGVLSLASLQ